MGSRHRKLVAIAAGGTGGHIFPALAVAEILRERNCDLLWLGNRKGLEARVATRAGFPFIPIEMEGVRGRGFRGWLRAPPLLMRAFLQAREVLGSHRVSAVLGMGGFVALPVGLAARSLGIPVTIHEQNRIPGTANRILAHLAQQVLTGFPETALPGAVFVGHPLRRTLRERAKLVEPKRVHRPLRILVIGGSQGAKVFNETLPALLAPFRKQIEIWHLSGKGPAEEVFRRYGRFGLKARVNPFLEEIEQAYLWADLAICRAGAMTIAELLAFGLGAIFVPFPFAIDDHQTANASYVAAQGGGVLLPQSDLGRLPSLLEELLEAPAKVEEMGRCARALSRREAAYEVARRCLS